MKSSCMGKESKKIEIQGSLHGAFKWLWIPVYTGATSLLADTV